MGKANDPSLKGLSGKIGNLVYYQRNGETYVRAAPGKQSKATKAKTSEPKRISQDVVRQTHAFLKNYKHLVRFGYQEHAVGAKTAYHRAASYTIKNSFDYRPESAWKVLDISKVRISLGDLTGPEEATASREGTGVRFTWRDNSWEGSAKPSDEAFVVLIHESRAGSRFVYQGSRRSERSHFLNLDGADPNAKWHAFLAFSQENEYSKKRFLSNSVYLGEV
ncbi:DUF6266 family protein [Algoriphagus confluentis]|uniref:Uncharacterized protein n=1 Tax=Algoriphagus confluentis TaxID=1697556 RepID=A0ABQ6PTT5_9BACT|nr:hypothetical protein Aconfl_33130 [Algoriphagus confluentis]